MNNSCRVGVGLTKMPNLNRPKPQPKLRWHIRAKNTAEIHSQYLRDAYGNDKTWSITNTAAELNRSFGSVSEDLLLASWLKSHPQIERFKTAGEALGYIRLRKRQLAMGD